MNQVFWPDGSVRMNDDLEDTSDGIEILQSKTKKFRTVFLNEACKDALEWCFPERGSYLHCDGYLFPSREGGSIQVGTFRKVLKEAACACGVKQNVGTHTCRKTWDGTSISIIPTRRTWISLCSSGRLGIVRRKSPSDILVLRMRKTRLCIGTCVFMLFQTKALKTMVCSRH